MIEVEIRARIKNIEKIKDELKKIDAKFIKTEKQVDRIFGHPMFLGSEKMIIEGGLSARIREVDDEKVLEFKEILRKSGGIEIKSKLSDINVGLKFLEKLQFSEAFIVSKLRKSYLYNNFTICLDSVDQLGDFIEIEKLINFSDDKEKARKECEDLLRILSPDSKIENKKYGDLMQEILNKK